ncbi:MAG: Holliday junction branch migration protein RuvA [Candidatus Caenarcaniphilales bacterium]|nr:Holliday junction branch migration protein RuvA [Candidatus Caenarcaniphilales bacterium]
MLAFLIGEVSSKLISPWRCLLDVNGIGFEVFLSQRSWQKLNQAENARLFTFLSLNPENPRIFGFCEEWEQTLFQTLEGVKGIGPKTALALLDGLSPDQFIHALQNDNPSLLTQVPGIGAKTAERLIFELKPKLRELNLKLAAQTSSHNGSNIQYQEVSDILLSLGYTLPEIDQALKANQETLQSDSPEEGLRACLSWLTQR